MGSNTLSGNFDKVLEDRLVLGRSPSFQRGNLTRFSAEDLRKVPTWLRKEDRQNNYHESSQSLLFNSPGVKISPGPCSRAMGKWYK